jgi:hypothetical protein
MYEPFLEVMVGVESRRSRCCQNSLLMGARLCYSSIKLLSAPSNEIDGNVRLNSDGLMQQVGDTER